MLRTIIALLLGLALLPAAAQNIYSYTDEQGVIHFTDREPDTEAPVAVTRMRAAPQSMLRTHRRGSEREPEWHFENRTHGPLEVEVTLLEPDNVRATPTLPRRFVLPPMATRKLFDVAPVDTRSGWSYRLSTRYMPGDPSARHDTGAAYLPPVAPGASFPIGQAFGGTFSHDSPENYHAVDITMPVGTPVHAARAGVVTDVERWFDEGGDDRDRFMYQSNYIRILHEDGTMAMYAHLDYRGIVVHPGQVVLEGDKIGRSGNTGFTTGPHLHFVVQRNAGMRLESVPFRFVDKDGIATTPHPSARLIRAE